MISETSLFLFITASLALILSPGPDVIYVVTRGMAQGRKVALVSAWGVCLGLAVHTAFAAVGLSALLAQSAVAFSIVKYAGAAYLIFLGAKALLSKESLSLSGDAVPATRLRNVFLQGVASNVLNPKVALFFLAFLPQFVDPKTGGAASQMVMLGSIFALLGLTWLCALAVFSGAISDRLARRPRLADRLRYLTGGVLIALGLRLALERR